MSEKTKKVREWKKLGENRKGLEKRRYSWIWKREGLWWIEGEYKGNTIDYEYNDQQLNDKCSFRIKIRKWEQKKLMDCIFEKYFFYLLS